jgi:hypothetical protein
MLVWARAFVCAKQNGFPMLAPQWFQLRLGALLRAEPVKRFYFSEFTNKGYIGGWRRWLILRRARRIPETELQKLKHNESNAQVQVIEFEGLDDYFKGLISHKQLILAELMRIANPKAGLRANRIEEPFIAVHIRRGDQTRQQKIPLSKIVQYTPIEWFVAAIKALRTDPRWETQPIKVFSDGSRDELKEVLDLPDCELVTTKKAIGDILAMARSNLLLASGYSTFSMWASFLGEMHTLYAPSKMQQKLFGSRSNSFEGEWTSNTPLPPFASFMKTGSND